MTSYYDVIQNETKHKNSEQPDLNQRPKDISFPTTVFRYYQLSYARFLFSSFQNIIHEDNCIIER